MQPSKTGEMAEWSNAAVLKTVDCNRSGGSNPSFSAKGNPQRKLWVFCFQERQKLAFVSDMEAKKRNAQSAFVVSMFVLDYHLGSFAKQIIPLSPLKFDTF